jgi:predicted Zn-dependent protease
MNYLRGIKLMNRFPAMAFLSALALSGCTGMIARGLDEPAPKASDQAVDAAQKRALVQAEAEVKRIAASGLLYEDDGLEKYLNDIAKRLQTTDVSRALSFHIRVVKNPFSNAFALPNGAIYVHTAILAHIDNEAQLATLLAHEMAHAIHRHTAKASADLRATSEAKGPLVGALGTYGENFGRLSTLASTRGYSRENEAEADAEGLKLVVKAGYDPREAPKFFERLNEEDEGAGERYSEEEKDEEAFIYSSHPRNKDRIRAYESLLKSDYASVQDGAKNVNLFRQYTMRLLLDNAELDIKGSRYAGARRTINKYLAEKSRDPRAYYLLGEASWRQAMDSMENAKSSYQKALSVRADHAESYRALGLMQLKMGDKKAAQTNLRQYLTLKPTAPDREYIQQYIRDDSGKP